MKRTVRIDDYSWFDVELDENNEPKSVTESRMVWAGGKDRGTGSKVMSERVRRAVAAAKSEADDHMDERHPSHNWTAHFSGNPICATCGCSMRNIYHDTMKAAREPCPGGKS